MPKSRAVKLTLAIGLLALTLTQSALAEGDIVAGEKLFFRKCLSCMWCLPEPPQRGQLYEV